MEDIQFCIYADAAWMLLGLRNITYQKIKIISCKCLDVSQDNETDCHDCIYVIFFLVQSTKATMAEKNITLGYRIPQISVVIFDCIFSFKCIPV